MKKARLFITFLFFYFAANSQEKKDVFPYEGGEQGFKKELNDYISKKIISNDSIAIYYAEVSLGKKNQLKFQISGGRNEDSLTKILTQFFSITSDKWQTGHLKECSVIIPIYIMSVCDLSKEGDVSWANLVKAGMPVTKKALFMSPFLGMYICGGDPDGDKNEIKRNWNNKETTITRN